MQALLGASRAVAFDLTAACSGFVLALVTGAQYIKTGTARNVLVIGADALSRYVDWRDRCAPLCCWAGSGACGMQRVLPPRTRYWGAVHLGASTRCSLEADTVA